MRSLLSSICRCCTALLALWCSVAFADDCTDYSCEEHSHENDVVHIVFSNHLDVGFGGIKPELGIDSTVINKYFDWHFPDAIRLGQYLRRREGMGLHCPSASEQEQFCQAAREGLVTWHAFPFNAQIEMLNQELLQGAFQLTEDVDARCGVHHKTVLSQRDVPGITRAILPAFKQVAAWTNTRMRAISVGVNKASATPSVPQNAPFIWRDDDSDTEVLAFWHPRGYGGKYMHKGNMVVLTPAQDCVRTPLQPDGRRDILCFSWRGDNDGPLQDPKEVMRVFEAAQDAFPGATVQASTFEKFVDRLVPFKSQTGEDGRRVLPVVTGEIGDTWIHGVGSDPEKVRNYRAVMRMRSQCLWEGSCVPQDEAFLNFTRLLLKVPEHTWGIDTKDAPQNWDVWANEAFREARTARPLFAVAEKSWGRQAQYIQWGIEASMHIGRHVSSGYHFNDTPTAHGAAPTVLSVPYRSPSSPPKVFGGGAAPTFSEAAARKLKDLDEGFDVSMYQAHTYRIHSEHSDSEDSQEGSEELRNVLKHRTGEKDAVMQSEIQQRSGVRSAGSVRGGSDEDLKQAEATYTRPEAGESGAGGCGKPPVKLKSKIWDVQADACTGKISTFKRIWSPTNSSGTDWAAGGAPFAELLYSTYSAQYFEDWSAGYVPMGADGFKQEWIRYDFGKPGSPSKDRQAGPELVDAWAYDSKFDGNTGIALKYEFSGWPVDEAGAPPSAVVLLHTWEDDSVVMVDVLYDDKAPTRLSEALWLRFAPPPAAAATDKLLMNKMASWISPSEIITNGSFNLHALGDGGIQVPSTASAWEMLQVAPMDTALVALGEPQVLPDIAGPSHTDQGFNFNLFNNAWGTNYVMWTPYGDGTGRRCKFRFVVTVRDTRLTGSPHWSPLQDPHFDHLQRNTLL